MNPNPNSSRTAMRPLGYRSVKGVRPQYCKLTWLTILQFRKFKRLKTILKTLLLTEIKIYTDKDNISVNINKSAIGIASEQLHLILPNAKIKSKATVTCVPGGN